MSPALYRVSLFTIASCGVLLSLIYSRGLPFLQYDSMVYLDFARSMAEGAWPPVSSSGMRFGHHPPLFSLLLAPLSLLSDPHKAGWVLNEILFFVNILLLAALARSASGGLRAAGLAAAALAAFSAPAMKLHARLISEPLYLAAGFAALLAVDVFLRNPRRPGGAYPAAAALAALAVLTRYSGAAFAAAGAAMFLFHRDLPRRGVLSLLFVFAAALPAGLFLASLGSGGGADRAVFFSPPGPGFLVETVRHFLSWFVPGLFPWKIAPAILFFALFAWTSRLRLKSGADNHSSLGAGLLVFAGASFLLSAAARTFFDREVVFTGRHLFPAYLALSVCFAAAACRALGQAGRFRAAFGAGLAVFLAIHCVYGVFYAMMGPGERQGYLGFHARSLVVLEATASAGRIYTNDLYMFPEREAGRVFPLPFKRERSTRKERPAYAAELAAVRLEMQKGARIAFFEREGLQAFPTAAELNVDLDLTEVQRGAAGVLYALKEA